MGVTGLWTVVAPTARPTQLASLNRKRLAVDASIWIYQFLKAVRDKEGNALRNSHVVGFFRRICKLLYFGIKPVFVFDGGAPILKRETIRKRARRREGRREDAARTAGKLLAVQVARAAEQEEKRRRAERERTPLEEELPADQELVYVEEIGMTTKERLAGRQFKKKDQYHLPDLDVSIENMGAPNDPRIMSQAELEEYARQFHSGEDINLYDFSKIDFESPFFLSLPAGDRYNILNAARLRSRLRMGYSKEQLDGMFPDRMAFSKFQIERVKERNELTQRLMHINGMAEDFLNQGGRIAGEKGKEYILVKNDGVDGGWALGVVSDRQGSKQENAIDLEHDDISDDPDRDSDEDEDFEDVAIEGLNRLPKTWQRKRKAPEHDMSFDETAAVIAKKRKAIYEARRAATAAPNVAPPVRPTVSVDDEPLFVPADDANDADDDVPDDLFEDVLPPDGDLDDEEEFQRTIAMSLELLSEMPVSGGSLATDHDSGGRGVADEDDDGFDLHTALVDSRKNMSGASTKDNASATISAAVPKFDGPLPFESLNLGKSLLGKKKSQRIEEDLSGGFERHLGDNAFQKERPPQPMPSWFNAAPSTRDLKHGTDLHEAEHDDHITSYPAGVHSEAIRPRQDQQIIDLEAEDAEDSSQQSIYLAVSQDDELPPLSQQSDDVQAEAPHDLHDHADSISPERRKLDEEREKRYELGRQIAAETEPEQVSTDQVADQTRMRPPRPDDVVNYVPSPEPATVVESGGAESDVEVEWSESEHGQPTSPGSLGTVRSRSDPTRSRRGTHSEDENEEFEDVALKPPTPRLSFPFPEDNVDIRETATPQARGDEAAVVGELGAQDTVSMEAAAAAAEEEFDYLSESEEELMRQLAIEAEEHARFASSLNNQKTSEQAVRDYENELKQLRNQQKRDRRDADEVTQVMVQECQALLRLFGLPYITAPMEAEAQCAELVHLGLVDGIVTDDSDIFLFGGTRIYKNMFNAAKFVECYLAVDLEKEFLLDRRRLIRFAHLLGSDYTDGLPGIGPVTALEILTDFDDLTEFKDWCAQVQLGRPQDLEHQLSTPFRRKFKKTVQKKLFLPSSFPDVRVDEAYLHPEVDSDPEPFQWGVPDLDKLRGFLMATIGWSQERTDEVLVPVIRDMNKRDVEGTQSNLTRFFSGGVGIGGRAAGKQVSRATLAAGGDSVEASAPRNRSGKESGRMKNAYKRLRGEAERKRKHQDMDNAEEIVAIED